MIKISDFTPSINSNKEHTNTANCNVIINNNKDVTESIEKYPTVTPTAVPEPLTPIYTNAVSNEKDLFKHLAIAFSTILKTNNPKLIANLVDQSGKVILSGDDLVIAVSLILGIDTSLIKISYENPEASCLGKVSPIKHITTIKVNGYDFNLAYNKQYNTLSDEFGISLKKCLIGI